MTASPAIGWICDCCGNSITRIEDGWVEWLACDGRGKARVEGLRLVHTRAQSPKSRRKNRCQYDARREFHDRRCLVEGLSLERFVGPDELMLLLSFILQRPTSEEFPAEIAQGVLGLWTLPLSFSGTFPCRQLKAISTASSGFAEP